MVVMKKITHERLHELFTYEADTGIFTRKSTGKIATSLHNGYVRIGIDYEEYRAHRLAYLYMTGEFPVGIIDHINHVKTDNRWCNLREVTAQENSRNLSLYQSNSSNTTGVYWHHRDQQWVSFIYIDGKKKHLGCFREKDNAINARQKANINYGFHENHGKNSTDIS